MALDREDTIRVGFSDTSNSSLIVNLKEADGGKY